MRRERLRVLYVIDSLGHGGAEQSLVEMVPELVARDVALIIVCLVPRETELLERATNGGARVLTAPSMSAAAQAVWLRNLIRRTRPQVIHTTLFRADMVGRVAALGSGVPVITSLVNTQYEPERVSESSIPAWKLRVARELERWSGRWLTDLFHVNSEAVRVAAIDRLGIDPQRIRKVPRGRDPERFSPRLKDGRDGVRRELGLDTGSPLIISVGRQEVQKGHRYLLEAFARVVQVHPEARLALVGAEGAATATIEEVIDRHRLTSSVLILGRREDVPRILGAADIFVLSSLWEGLPNVVIEASAVGVPVVATEIPPVLEAVEPGESALLAPPTDVASLADQMIRLIEDERLRETMSERGRQVFLDRFTIGPVAEAMAALYREVAGAVAVSSREVGVDA